MFYLTTWLFFLFDVVIKILIYLGYPVLFDSVISVCTICLRSRANLQYGLELKSIFKHTETDARRSALSGGGVVGSISSSNTNNKLGNKNGSTIPAITKGTTAADEEKV